MWRDMGLTLTATGTRLPVWKMYSTRSVMSISTAISVPLRTAKEGRRVFVVFPMLTFAVALSREYAHVCELKKSHV